MLLLSKSVDELNSKAAARLSAEGINTSPGSIAKLFYMLVNEDLADFYSTLNSFNLMHILSTSEGTYLDALGSLLNCSRTSEESDSDYRYRISRQTTVLERANESAVRLAALVVEGVQDVVLKPYSHGPGTFSVIVITEPTATDHTSILNLVRTSIASVSAYGTKFYVYEPTSKAVKIRIKLQTETMSTSDFMDLSNNLTNVVRQYLNSLKIGEEFNSQSLTALILGFDKRIKKFAVLSLQINGREYDLKTMPCRWNERFVLSSEPDALIIS